jgi:hypothetical protein
MNKVKYGFLDTSLFISPLISYFKRKVSLTFVRQLT